MNKRFTLLAAGVIALFSACGDNVVESYTPETPVIPDPASPTAVAATAKLNVIVQDGSDKSLITGAKVTLLSTGNVITSAAGVVLFDSVAVGQHGVRAELDGYASALAVGEIGSEISENIFQATNGYVRVSLYPLTASLEGHLRYDNGIKKQPAPAGTEVRLVLNTNNNTLENSQFTAITGADGKYTFPNLPAVGSDLSYRVYAQTVTIGGVTYPTQEVYSSTATSSALLPGKPVSFGYADISENTSVFDVITYTDRIIETSPVVIEFSDSIDVAKFSTNQITISPTLSFTAAVSTTDKTKLTLTPVGGKWVIDPVLNPSNTGNFTVNITGLKSVSGNSIKSANGSKTVILLAENSAFELLSYTNRINVNSNLVFTFSDAIDATKFNTSSITISTSGVNSFDYVIDATGKLLTLTPKGGKWIIDPASSINSFNITVNAMSVKGKSYNTGSRQVILLSGNDNFDFLAYTERISPESNVVFTFSDAIDPTKFSSNLISISNPTLDFDYELVGQTLVIKPKGGTWVIDPVVNQGNTGTFSVYVNNLTSVKGKKINNDVGGQVSLLLENSQFSLVSYTDRINIDGDVVFTFTDVIDADRVSTNTVTNNINQDVILSYSEDKTQLTVKPKGGKWNTTNQSFSIYIDGLPSVKGRIASYISRTVYLTHTFKLLSDYGSEIRLETNTDVIKFGFSDAIDATKFFRGDGTNATVILSSSQHADITVQGDSIFIAPLGRWTSDGFTIYFSTNSSYVLTSVKGEVISSNGLPTNGNPIYVRFPVVDLSNTAVTGLVATNADKIDAGSSQLIQLKWDRVAGLAGNTGVGYRILAKHTNSAEAWSLVAGQDNIPEPVITNPATTVSREFTLTGSPFANGNEYTFVVQAFNSNTRTLLTTASTVSLKDVVGPTISSGFSPVWGENVSTFNSRNSYSLENNSGSYSYRYGYYENDYSTTSIYGQGLNYYLQNGYSGNQATINYDGSGYQYEDDVVAIATLVFNENLDTTSITSGFSSDGVNIDNSLPADIAERLSIKRVWVNKTQYNSLNFNLIIQIKAGDPITTQLDTYYVVSGLKDRNGNPAKIIYKDGSGVDIEPASDVLRFKITANTP